MYENCGCNGLGETNWTDLISQIGKTASGVITSVRAPMLPGSYYPPVTRYGTPSFLPADEEGYSYNEYGEPIVQQSYAMDSVTAWLPWIVVGGGALLFLMSSRR